MNQKVDSIFGGLTHKQLAQKSLLSRNWLLDRLKDPKLRLKRVSVPTPGRMLLFSYKAKWAQKLPFWDSYPVVVVVDTLSDGFTGLNFHYLPLEARLQLFKILTNQRDMSRVNARYAMQITYQKLKALTTSSWSFCFKRYLYNQLLSKPIDLVPEDWYHILHLPIAVWNNASEASVYKAQRG